MRVIRKRIVMGALMAALSLRIVQGQSPDPTVAKFFSAGDAERVAMVEARPELLDVPFRQAITTLGIEAVRRGDFALAERYQNTVLWLGNHANSDAVRAVAYINLSSVNGQRGDFAAAQKYATAALRFAEQENDLESVQSALANLGIIQRRLGDPESALQSFERALTLATQLGLQDNAARVLNNIGLAHSDLGNMAVARDYLDRSLAIKMKLDDSGRVTQDIARSLNNIGTLYEELGDYPQSLSYFQRANVLLEKSGGGPSLSSSISNVGHVYLKMGQPDRARSQFEQALVIAKAQGDKPRVATIEYLLGYLERDAGHYTEAEAIQRHSLALREEMGESMPLVESLTELSSLALIGGRAAEAYELASRAVTIATDARLSSRLWKAQLVQGEALIALKRDVPAMAAYQASIDGIELMRQQTVGGDRGRQMYLGQRIAPYYALARVHANAGRSFEALLAIERARSRTLLDVIALGQRSTRLLSSEQRTRERELTQAVFSLSSQIDTLLARRPLDAAEVSDLEGRLSRARLDRDAYTAALYESKPDLRLARGDAPMITRDELTALVKPNTAIVSLVLDNTTVWAYVITRTSGQVSIAVRRIPAATADVVKLADQFAKQVATRDLGFSVNARKLYDLFFVDTKIEPMLNGKSRVVIVPEGPLWRVPFQALQTPRDTFFIEERAIAYAPSVSALAALDRRRQSRGKREPYLLALGDPAIDVTAASPTDGSRRILSRLPQAAREVKALGQLYGEANSRVLVAEQATEAALRDNIGRATVVHVATHGVLDDLSPMYSHVMLAPSTGQGSDADGRLDAWELMNQPLDVDLAVLSACETARGPVGDGEGVIGLSWSLFAAGASTAVVSQWEVDSASTTALMIAFHERLLLSKPGGSSMSDPPEALRVAAMRLMRGAAYRHPFYWAGFVVVGAS